MAATSAIEIGTMVRDRRKDLGFTQDVLAERAGVSRKWVSELERGKTTVQLDAVLAVFGALKIDMSALAVAVGASTAVAASTVAAAMTGARTTRTTARAARAPLVAADAATAATARRRSTNAELNDRIRNRARHASFGTDLLTAGVAAVGLDDEGRIVRYEPDGTTTLVG